MEEVNYNSGNWKEDIQPNGEKCRRQYNLQGHLIAEHHYDSLGREIKRMLFTNDNKLSSEITYEYEGTGRNYTKCSYYDGKRALLFKKEQGKRGKVY